MKELSPELLGIIKKKEKATTELKEARNHLPENLFDTVCSMLNRRMQRYLWK